MSTSNPVARIACPVSRWVWQLPASLGHIVATRQEVDTLLAKAKAAGAPVTELHGRPWGIYSGYELFEATPVREGSEEYLDSEKYQLRHWDFDRPDSLWPLIARINQRENRVWGA